MVDDQIRGLPGTDGAPPVLLPKHRLVLPKHQTVRTREALGKSFLAHESARGITARTFLRAALRPDLAHDAQIASMLLKCLRSNSAARALPQPGHLSRLPLPSR